MFAISSDEERYEGQYDTIDNAIDEAANGYAMESFWVGECVEPTQPEELFDAKEWLQSVAESDDYRGEWAEDWEQSLIKQARSIATEPLRFVLH